MLDHVTVCASDFATSLTFYDAVLGALGLSRVYELGDEEEDEPGVEVAAFGGDGDLAQVWLVGGSTTTRGVHLAFRAATRSVVEAFHEAALAAGGTSHDAPRRWPIYRTGDFNAIVADPDGNLIEAVATE